MPRSRTPVAPPEGEPLITVREAAFVLKKTPHAISNNIRRGLIPPSVIVQDEPGARLLLDRAKLEELYPPSKRGLRRAPKEKRGRGRPRATQTTTFEKWEGQSC